MRTLLASLIFSALLLGCGGASEDGENVASDINSHFMKSQEQALEKAKQVEVQLKEAAEAQRKRMEGALN